MITFNDEQINAIKKAIEWYFTKSYKDKIFTILGYAGCGKTTIAKTIIKMLGLTDSDVIFATLTSKASLVLRLKGNVSNTIHKTFYVTYKNKNTIRFSLKKKISYNTKLIVIDEMSMVNQKMLEDILSFGIPIMGLMDSGQLPAIFGTNIFMEKPSLGSVFLTKIMRQDDSTGILELSFMARNGQPIPYGKYKNSEVTQLENVWDKLLDFDVILCWKNSTRRQFNSLIRKKLGYNTIFPSKGEKILCLRNNYNYEIEYNEVPIYLINGLQGVVIENSKEIINDDLNLLNIKFVPDFINNESRGDICFDVNCFQEVFKQYEIDVTKEAFIETLCDDSLDDETIGNIGILDYGYCITVHKSQGSEWNKVLVLNEFKGNQETYNRWLYTAITRAKKSVTIVDLK